MPAEGRTPGLGTVLAGASDRRLTNESDNADNGREAAQGTTCESEGGSRAYIDELAAAPREHGSRRRTSAVPERVGPAGGCVGDTRRASGGLAAIPTSAQRVVAPRAPVRADARPSVGEGMIPERAGCGKSARPVRRAATGNGAGINRIMPARHRASRRLYVRRAKVHGPSGCKSHPARVVPAGSNRNGGGGNEAAEASDGKGSEGTQRAHRP